MEKSLIYITKKGESVEVVAFWEPEIGLTISDLSGKEYFCGNGGKSPLFPQDMKLTKEQLIKKDGYDTDALLAECIEFVLANDTISHGQLNMIAGKYTPPTLFGRMCCAFNG